MCKLASAKVMSTSDFDPRCSGLLLLEVAIVVKVEGCFMKKDDACLQRCVNVCYHKRASR